MTDIERVAAKMDDYSPNWTIDMASEYELREFAMDARQRTLGIANARLRRRVADRLFHPIVNAALAAGLVTLVAMREE